MPKAVIEKKVMAFLIEEPGFYMRSCPVLTVLHQGQQKRQAYAS